MSYRLIGIDSSPYTVKVRAFLRYQRIAHQWIARMPQFFDETQHVRPLLMPVVQYPDGQYHVDSTPIMRELDGLHANGRSVVPASPELAFINDLVEDFADEWLTKVLFHYRFGTAVDSAAGAAWVMDDVFPDLDTATLEKRVREFVERQHARKALVGCTPANAALFEACFSGVMEALEAWVATDRFLFGSRPSSADFGLYGQLRTLSLDPTPAGLMRKHAPRLRHWVGRVDDLSGVDGAWDTPAVALARVEPLLRLCGTYYLPFLAANHEVVREGRDAVSVTLAGKTYQQAPFRYQAKCYAQLLATFDALTDDARDALQALLERTGCLGYLDAGTQ